MTYIVHFKIQRGQNQLLPTLDEPNIERIMCLISRKAPNFINLAEVKIELSRLQVWPKQGATLQSMPLPLSPPPLPLLSSILLTHTLLLPLLVHPLPSPYLIFLGLLPPLFAHLSLFSFLPLLIRKEASYLKLHSLDKLETLPTPPPPIILLLRRKGATYLVSHSLAKLQSSPAPPSPSLVIPLFFSSIGLPLLYCLLLLLCFPSQANMVSQTNKEPSIPLQPFQFPLLTSLSNSLFRMKRDQDQLQRGTLCSSFVSSKKLFGSALARGSFARSCKGSF